MLPSKQVGIRRGDRAIGRGVMQHLVLQRVDRVRNDLLTTVNHDHRWKAYGERIQCLHVHVSLTQKVRGRWEVCEDDGSAGRMPLNQPMNLAQPCSCLGRGLHVIKHPERLGRLGLMWVRLERNYLDAPNEATAVSGPTSINRE
jgi:hypothetical protein